MRSDLDIAHAAPLRPIDMVAEEIGFTADLLEVLRTARHESES